MTADETRRRGVTNPIKKALSETEEPEARLQLIEEIRDVLFDASPLKDMPVDRVRWVPVDSVEANTWNPNSVAKNEMRLLYTSIDQDGYTQPVVVIEKDDDPGKYVVVDGFHRYTILKTNHDIRERTGGLLPVVVLDKSVNEQMASTVRHNRARGKHAVGGMSNMVFEMLEGGWTDSQICAELGLSADELLRLKHITGFSKLFENVEYRKAWVTRSQIKIRKKFEEEGEQLRWAGAPDAPGDPDRRHDRKARLAEASKEEIEAAIADAVESDLVGDGDPAATEMIEAIEGEQSES